ncbi:hypothetical protein GQX74_015052 [Glossina fuscipes]|nr:hypothetical protein GQX74_015052 [Glossina fuscipes]
MATAVNSERKFLWYLVQCKVNSKELIRAIKHQKELIWENDANSQGSDEEYVLVHRTDNVDSPLLMGLIMMGSNSLLEVYMRQHSLHQIASKYLYEPNDKMQILDHIHNRSYEWLLAGYYVRNEPLVDGELSDISLHYGIFHNDDVFLEIGKNVFNFQVLVRDDNHVHCGKVFKVSNSKEVLAKHMIYLSNDVPKLYKQQKSETETTQFISDCLSIKQMEKKMIKEVGRISDALLSSGRTRAIMEWQLEYLQTICAKEQIPTDGINNNEDELHNQEN